MCILAQAIVEPGTILTTLGVGMSTWVLREVVQLKQEIAVLRQRFDDKNCNDCMNFKHRPITKG